MNELNVYSVYDVKADAYITPFFLPTDAMAIRAFTDCVSDPGHRFGAHPEDYTLYKIGVFDISSGQILDIDQNEALAVTAMSVKPRPELTTIDGGKE